MTMMRSLAALLLLAAPLCFAVDLKPETTAAFNHYVSLSESRMSGEVKSGPFLYIDALSAADRNAVLADLTAGQVVSHSLETQDHGKTIDIPDGLVHHWMGIVFIPGTTLQKTLSLLQDYNEQSKFYSPDVQRSRLLEVNGNHYKVFMQLKKTKVVTVYLDSEYDVVYTQLDANRAISDSRSNRITEVEKVGTPDEYTKPVGHDSGYMWRLNSYWRFLERDGGVYIQLEAISLTRDIPTGLGWLVRPFVTTIPRESLDFTLSRTRDALANKH
jgi:hypothetical protein